MNFATYPCLRTFGIVWILACLTGPGRADDKPAPRERKAIDLRVDKSLGVVIDRGAEVYNSGDHAGCCRLYEGALLAIAPMLDHRPGLQKVIDRELVAALRNPKMDERAFLLRAQIDKICETVNPTSPAAGKRIDLNGKLSREEQVLFELTNKEREKEGLTPLRFSRKLFLAARAHSANMAKQNKLDHHLDDKTPGDRLKEVGYAGAGWGENIAGGQRSPAQAIAAWMGSEGHRANILNPSFTEIGIGIVADAGGGSYFTQVFGVPR